MCVCVCAVLPGSNLKEVYIRRNSISDLTEVGFLAKLQGLRVLWMSENPVSSVPGYRDYVIKVLPQLVRLDNEGESAEWDGMLTGWLHRHSNELCVPPMQEVRCI